MLFCWDTIEIISLKQFYFQFASSSTELFFYLKCFSFKFFSFPCQNILYPLAKKITFYKPFSTRTDNNYIDSLIFNNPQPIFCCTFLRLRLSYVKITCPCLLDEFF